MATKSRSILKDVTVDLGPLSADPSGDIKVNNARLFVSDGTGSGDAGDVFLVANIGGTEYTFQLADPTIDAGTTKTSPGTVTKWMKVHVEGTDYFVPMYSSKTS